MRFSQPWGGFFSRFSMIKLLPLFMTLGMFLHFPGSSYYRNLNIDYQDPKVRPAPFILPTPAQLPSRQISSAHPPVITARSAIVQDIHSQIPLYQKQPTLKLMPASTTKMLTALVAVQNCGLDQIVTVGEVEVSRQDSLMGLVPKERISVRNLLYGLLLASGNDAALVLSQVCSSQEDFVSLMNKQAKSLRLDNSHFTNPTGLDEEGHYSTAADLARLASAFLKNQTLAQIAATQKIVVGDADGQYIHRLENRNTLLGTVEGVNGIKTGYTNLAGECIVVSAIRNDHAVVVVLLGSQSRIEESTQLLDWAFRSHKWQQQLL